MDFSRPLKIDRFLTLSCRVLPGPMAGVMNPVFCLAASRLGLIRNWVTPFQCVSSGSVPSLRRLKAKLDPFRNSHDLIAQLLGHDSGSLAETAPRLAHAGAHGINLNFACPAPLVLKNGNGGAVLKDPDLVHAISAAVAASAQNVMNVSVKIRCGAEDAMQELPVLADAVKSAGIRFVIAHFRTVQELYDPVPPVEAYRRLARLRELLGDDVILIGNGDIRSFSDGERMCRETGCDGIAAGRAILTDPFLLQRIAENDNTPSTEAERLCFLRGTIDCAKALGYPLRKWLRTGFLEFARMCYGRESEQFRRIASDPEQFAAEN